MSRPLYDVVSQAVKILQGHPTLPEPISFAVNQEGVWVIPWVHGAPITALLQWHDAMTEPGITSNQMDDVFAVTVKGLIDDLPFVATSTTYREVRVGATGWVSVEELRRVADTEEAYVKP